MLNFTAAESSISVVPKQHFAQRFYPSPFAPTGKHILAQIYHSSSCHLLIEVLETHLTVLLQNLAKYIFVYIILWYYTVYLHY